MKQVSARTAPLQASQEHKQDCERALRRHFEHGRIEERDLELRLQMLEQAVTLGELRRLTADLPDDEPRWRRLPLLRR